MLTIILIALAAILVFAAQVSRAQTESITAELDSVQDAAQAQTETVTLTEALPEGLNLEQAVYQPLEQPELSLALEHGVLPWQIDFTGH